MKKETVFWIIFYTFPVIINIGLFVNNINTTINISDVYTKISLIETNTEKKLYCVIRYYCWNSKISNTTNIYTLETLDSGLRHSDKNYRFHWLLKYPKKDIFFQYDNNISESDKVNKVPNDIGIFYDKEHQQLIVRHSVPKECISVQKYEIREIKVIYEYEEESKQ